MNVEPEWKRKIASVVFGLVVIISVIFAGIMIHRDLKDCKKDSDCCFDMDKNF